MICPFCGLEHPPQARFCPVTGQKLESSAGRCPQCGAEIAPQNPFCTNCGFKAGQAAASPELLLQASDPASIDLQAPPTPWPAGGAGQPSPAGNKKRKLLPAYVGLVLLGLFGMAIASILLLNGSPGIPPTSKNPTLRNPTGPSAFASSALPNPTAGPLPSKTASTLPTQVLSTNTPRPVSTLKPTTAPTRTLQLIFTPTQAGQAFVGTPAIGSRQVSARDGMVLLYVPAGNFWMGSDPAMDSTAAQDEMPIHFIYLDAFWIDRTEVSNGMYKNCVIAGECRPPESDKMPSNRDYYNSPIFDNYPVVYISREDAASYCVWAGRRIPTEAQWEKAARGTDKRIYPWGNLLDFDKRASFGLVTNLGLPSPVGSFPDGASPYGALDMAGNVFEWVSDIYNATYYHSSEPSNPLGPVLGEYAVVRGGSWVIKDPAKLKTTYRLANLPSNRDADDGFRCVLPVGK